MGSRLTGELKRRTTAGSRRLASGMGIMAARRVTAKKNRTMERSVQGEPWTAALERDLGSGRVCRTARTATDMAG
jgi:hypothetical protein